MKKKIILLSTVFFSLIFMSNAKAFDPVSHYLLAQRFLTETNNQISNLCRNYPREFIAGTINVDHSIAYYYVEGGKVYRLFHNWQYYRMCQDASVTDAEHCMCYGIALGHYIPDSFAHNFYIPDHIRDWKMQNWYWHPLVEGRVAASIIKEHPEAYTGLQDSLDVLFENPRLIDILQYAAGTDSPVDVKQQLLVFKTLLGKDWVDVYRPGEDNWLGKYVWPSLATFISTLSDYDDAKPYFEKSLVLMNKLGNDMSLYNQCDNNACPISPHGFEALDEANAEVYSSTIIIGLIMLGVLILLITRVFKIKLFKKR